MFFRCFIIYVFVADSRIEGWRRKCKKGDWIHWGLLWSIGSMSYTVMNIVFFFFFFQYTATCYCLSISVGLLGFNVRYLITYLAWNVVASNFYEINKKCLSTRNLQAISVIGKEEGLKGYWKGNLPQVIYIPTSLNFWFDVSEFHFLICFRWYESYHIVLCNFLLMKLTRWIHL